MAVKIQRSVCVSYIGQLAFSKIESSNAILFSYPIFFVHVIIIDCCSNIYWKVCISAVGTCYGMAM
jgi:hypothetical protein